MLLYTVKYTKKSGSIGDSHFFLNNPLENDKLPLDAALFLVVEKSETITVVRLSGSVIR